MPKRFFYSLHYFLLFFIWKPCILYFLFLFFFLREIFNINQLCNILYLACKQKVGAGKVMSMFISEKIWSVHFLFKDGKDPSCEGRDWWAGCVFPPELAFQLWFLLLYLLFPICILTWRLNNYISCQWKNINMKNGSKKETILVLML